MKSFLTSKDGRTVASNYTALLFIQGANMVLPLVILPYLVRILGASKYGLVMFAQAFCTILYVFVEFGFNLSATRRISMAQDDKEERALIFSSVLAIKGLLLIAVFFIYIIIIFSFERFNIEKSVYLLSFGVVVGQAIFPDWFFQGIEKMGFIAIVNVIAKVIFTLLIFVFIAQESDYELVPLFNATGFVIAGALSLVISLNHTKLVKPKKTTMIELIKESSSLFVSNFAARLFNAANLFILGIFAGDFFAGIYASMEKLIVAIKSFFAPLYQAIYPWLSKQNKRNQVASIKKIFPFVLAISCVFTGVSIGFGDYILNLLFDNEQINSYSYVFKIMSTTAVLSALNMMLVSLYFPAAGMYKTRMKVLLYSGIFNVIISIILVNVFNVLGTAIAAVATEALLLILCYVHYRKVLSELDLNA